MHFSKIQKKMVAGLERGIYSGAALLIGRSRDIVFQGYYGHAGLDSSHYVTEKTLFDLASLTKIMATTALFMKCFETDQRILDRPLLHYYPEMTGEKAELTPKALLAHVSGLPHWRPYYLKFTTPPDNASLSDVILKEALVYKPWHGVLYSDLGFMLLKIILEKELDQEFGAATCELLYEPLGVAHQIMFKPHPQFHEIAATRTGDQLGAVHDLNARGLDGISGHAGLFGTAEATARIVQEFLRCYYGHTGIFRRETVELFVKRIDFPMNTTRALGFNTPSEADASCSNRFSKRSFGHTGFTGTSFWADPEADLYVVMLTNRVIMGESDLRIQDFRPELHELVFEEVNGEH